MIALAGLLVLVAVALLVGGLSGGDTVLLWSSVGVSGLAAVVLAVQTARRNRATAARAAEAARATTAEKATAPAEATPTTEATAPAQATTSAQATPAGAPAPPATPATGSAATTPEEDTTAAEAEEAPAPVVPAAPAVERPATRRAATPVTGGDGEPPEEEVEVTDLLLVIDLTDEVVVVDEHPRYHLAGCSQTAGAEEIPLPLVEAREDGFTACGVCCPDQHLAAAERSRRAAAKSS